MSCMQFYKQIRRYVPQKVSFASYLARTFQKEGNLFMLISSQKDKQMHEVNFSFEKLRVNKKNRHNNVEKHIFYRTVRL